MTRLFAGKVVVQAAMSLDGFIAGPDDSMDWVFQYTTPDEFPEIVQATGAMLSGRRSYDVGQRDAGKPSGEAYGGAWQGPSFVLTHNPPADTGVTFLSGDIEAAVATGKAAAGAKNLVVVGADVAAQCLQRDLVDEILVVVLPVLLGAGTHFYSSAAGRRIDLEPVRCSQSGSVQLMQFNVLKHDAGD
ncbi:MAG TPA: dihydrofolate reductase family protein [Streptosporangiaceae bacterium]|nr:dihydrofolate reductase family protein [Streptosporangiaceae bacterium]